MKQFSVKHFLVTCVVGTLLSGCAQQEGVKPKVDLGVYSVSFRQTPPQPTYNRRSWVLPPDWVPNKSFSPGDAPMLNPVFHIKVNNATLTEVARLLAEATRYSSYCDGSKCKRTITLNSLGTVEEIATQATKKSGAVFVVDHQAREVRVDSESIHS